MIASGQSRELAMQRPSEDRVLSSATDDGGEEEVDLFVLTYNCGGFSHANRWRDDESMARQRLVGMSEESPLLVIT